MEKGDFIRPWMRIAKELKENIMCEISRRSKTCCEKMPVCFARSMASPVKAIGKRKISLRAPAEIFLRTNSSSWPALLKNYWTIAPAAFRRLWTIKSCWAGMP